MARKGRGGGRLAPSPRPSPNLMEDLQTRMLALQEVLAQETVRATAGGGAVTVEMTGQQKVVSVDIQPEVVDPQGVEMLEDLIVAAVNEALEASRELMAKRMGELTGGMGIPGLV